MATRQVAGRKFPGACFAVTPEEQSLSLIVTRPGTLTLQDAKPTLSGYCRTVGMGTALGSARDHQEDFIAGKTEGAAIGGWLHEQAALGSLAGIQARGLTEKAVDDEAEKALYPG